jgi:hypothetical protein
MLGHAAVPTATPPCAIRLMSLQQLGTNPKIRNPYSFEAAS